MVERIRWPGVYIDITMRFCYNGRGNKGNDGDFSLYY